MRARGLFGDRAVVRALWLAPWLGLTACGAGAPSQIPAPSTPEHAGGGVGAGSSPEAPPPPRMSGEIRRFEKAGTHLRVDKVGADDGSLAPDGVMDHVYELDIDGPADGVALASADDRGEPNGEVAADTFTGNDPLPEGTATLGGFGKHTLGVGVFQDGKLLNAADGHLPALPPGRHALLLHVSLKAPPKAGGLRVFVRFTDGSVVKGPAVAFR